MARPIYVNVCGPLIMSAAVMGWIALNQSRVVTAQNGSVPNQVQPSFEVLYEFALPGPASPTASLIEGRDGSLYGTTNRFGASDLGTIFRMAADRTVTVLYIFKRMDGLGPLNLIQASDGNFYGTAMNTAGLAIFRMTPERSFTVVNSSMPLGPGELIEGRDGNVYGTVRHQVVFQMTRDTTLRKLHSFTGRDGVVPWDAIIQGRDGNLYGNGWGGVFRLSVDGALTMLHAFTGPDAAFPGAFLQAQDGNFYGTTVQGCESSACRGPFFPTGTIFRMAPDGTTTTLHTFRGAQRSAYPNSTLMQARDGNFYGTTWLGGAADQGTIFKMTPNGIVTILHEFTGKDGAAPSALIHARDGSLYGMTLVGGSTGGGTIFKVSLDGKRASSTARPQPAATGVDRTSSSAVLATDQGTITTVAQLSAQSGPIVPITSTRTQEGVMSYWEITQPRADQLPPWNPRLSPLAPLSVGDAVKVGEAWLKQQNPEVKTFDVASVNMSRGYGVFAQKDRWFYTLYFDPVVGGRRLAGGGNFMTVVLMDGSVVEPRVENRGAGEPTSTNASAATPPAGPTVITPAGGVRDGSAVAETGARGQGWLSTGSGAGSDMVLDVADFCCPDYLQTMNKLIATNMEFRSDLAGTAIVKFTIQRDGTLTQVVVEKGSSDVRLDRAAARAITLTKLPPLPSQFPNPTLTVHFKFIYTR